MFAQTKSKFLIKSHKLRKADNEFKDLTYLQDALKVLAQVFVALFEKD